MLRGQTQQSRMEPLKTGMIWIGGHTVVMVEATSRTFCRERCSVEVELGYPGDDSRQASGLNCGRCLRDSRQTPGLSVYLGMEEIRVLNAKLRTLTVGT